MSNPKMLVLETTQDCNLHCVMCPRHSLRISYKSAEKPLSDENFRKLTPVLAAAERIEFGGLGEPLVDRSLLERIKYIRKYNPTAHISLYTNGQLLNTAEKVNIFLPLINEVNISINGISSYNKIMAPGTLEILTANLELITEYQKQTVKPVSLIAGYVVMRDNLPDILPFISFIINYKFHSAYFKDLWITYPELAEQSIKNDLELFEKAKQTIKLAIATGRSHGIDVDCEESLLHAPKY